MPRQNITSPSTSFWLGIPQSLYSRAGRRICLRQRIQVHSSGWFIARTASGKSNLITAEGALAQLVQLYDEPRTYDDGVD